MMYWATVAVKGIKRSPQNLVGYPRSGWQPNALRRLNLSKIHAKLEKIPDKSFEPVIICKWGGLSWPLGAVVQVWLS